jgi:hypothetical protein
MKKLRIFIIVILLEINSEGLILVSKGDKFGYIDSSGNEVVEVKYDLLNSFNGNFAIAKNQEKFGIISREGAEIIPCIYDDIFNFNIDGIAYLKQTTNGMLLVKMNLKTFQKLFRMIRIITRFYLKG